MPVNTPKRRHSHSVNGGVLLVAVVVVVFVVVVEDVIVVPLFSLASDTVRTPPTTRMAPSILSKLNGIWVA